MNKFQLGIKSFFLTRKTKKFSNKSKVDPERFSLQYRNDYLVNKITKILKSLKINVKVEGYENLPKTGPCLIVANHQDNVDALVLIYALKKQTEDKSENNKIATFIAKQSLQYRKSTRYPLTSINTFFLDRNNVKKSLETYNEFGKFIKTNKTYGVIFPEGTRNRNGEIGEFKAGALKIAKKELLTIVPVTINNSVQALNLKRKKNLTIEVVFHKKITSLSFVNQNTIALADRVEKIIKSKFKEPEYPFIDKEIDEENTKIAKKWHKKQNKIAKKEAQRERKEREHERKILEAEEKENKKYEKYVSKKERKSKKNN